MVGTIVDNPPPQLKFEWEALGEAEQLALGRLGQAAGQTGDSVSFEVLSAAMVDGRSPSGEARAELEATLDALQERGLIHEGADGYRFAVDLMRR